MTFPCNSIRCRRGFTLLELMLVLLILGLAASIVSVNIGKSLSGRTLKSEAVKLKNSLRLARELSLSYRRAGQLTVNEDSGTYGIMIGNRSHGESHTLPQGFTLTGSSVYFYPKGHSSGGRIEIHHKEGKGYAVVVDEATGTARIEGL